ncbi:MAG TPA: hypothetical protein G4O17_04050 [Dehalococcoidia bacterium]|jgi:hypothetical protein|nr:hypothetical protein [Dehalococcoidia bacterium]
MAILFELGLAMGYKCAEFEGIMDANELALNLDDCFLRLTLQELGSEFRECKIQSVAVCLAPAKKGLK